MAGSYLSWGDTWESVHACCAAVDAGCTDVKLVTDKTHIGGPMIQGLSAIDLGKTGGSGIGYLSEEYFHKLARMLGSNVRLTKDAPFTAEEIFKWMLDFRGISVYVGKTLTAVNKTGARVDSIVAGGITFAADQFHDGCEAGDMAVMGGMTSTVGREAAGDFAETLGGFYPVESSFVPFDCYASPGVLLPGFSEYPAMDPGDADGGVMGYGLRLPITKNVQFKLDWPLPDNYDTLQFEYLIRAMPPNADWKPFVGNPCLFGILDMNAEFGIPEQWAWGDGNQAVRDAIFDHVYSTELGWLWWLANDPSVDPTVQAYVRSYGLDSRCFTDSSPTPQGVPKEMYVRNSRRCHEGSFFLDEGHPFRQQNIQVDITHADSFAMGYYAIDWKSAQKLAVVRGGVAGFISDGIGNNPDPSVRQPTNGPYQLPARMGRPDPTQLVNVTLGRCQDVTSVASGGTRIDLQSANFSSGLGMWGGMAAAAGTTLDLIAIADVQDELIARGQVLAP